MRKRALLLHVLLSAAFAASASRARAGAGDDMAIAQGKQLYGEYCVSCHGAGGKGDGPAATKLGKPLADLTTIAKRNGGTFPFYDVMLKISNRPPTGQDQDTSLPGSMTSSHGGGSMPGWGQIFANQEGSKGTALDLQLQTTGKIMLITEYLQSIQVK